MPKKPSTNYTPRTRMTSRGECIPVTYLCPVDIYEHLQQVKADLGRSLPLQIDTMLRRDMARGVDKVTVAVVGRRTK